MSTCITVINLIQAAPHRLDVDVSLRPSCIQPAVFCWSSAAACTFKFQQSNRHCTVGRTPVFGRRTDPVLRSACTSRRVTTVWVNRPLQVSQLGQLSLSSFWSR